MAILGLLAVVAATSTSRAGPVPSNQLAALIVRAVAYDRNLATRTAGPVTIVILYAADDRSSTAVASALASSTALVANEATIGGRRVRVEKAPWSDARSLDDLLRRDGAALLYVCPGLDGSLAAVTDATWRRKVLSVGGDDEEIRHGITLAISRHDERTVMIVSLGAAKREGVRFEAGFLGLVTVVE